MSQGDSERHYGYGFRCVLCELGYWPGNGLYLCREPVCTKEGQARPWLQYSRGSWPCCSVLFSPVRAPVPPDPHSVTLPHVPPFKPPPRPSLHTGSPRLQTNKHSTITTSSRRQALAKTGQLTRRDSSAGTPVKSSSMDRFISTCNTPPRQPEHTFLSGNPDTIIFNITKEQYGIAKEQDTMNVDRLSAEVNFGSKSRCLYFFPRWIIPF